MRLALGKQGSNNKAKQVAEEQKFKIRIKPYNDVVRRGTSRVYVWHCEPGHPKYGGTGWWRLIGVMKDGGA